MFHQDSVLFSHQLCLIVISNAIGLPSLSMLLVGSNSFNNSRSYLMNNLTSLRSVKMASRSFYSVSSFSMTIINPCTIS